MSGFRSRSGSALLIVLGMMSFVLVSAIAFSAYMRYSRMPSSYLRRTSSSRMLAKAALAEAIDIIDNSIGNSNYPGQTGQAERDYNRVGDDSAKKVVDYWEGRCFIGSNRLCSAESTVSTLCVEALAYIPAPLINEVRYYSRRSYAATWRTMGFDSGRFAFTAVDVSDYYDVNRVRGSYEDSNGDYIFGRTSADEGRINLAHVFEDSQSHSGFSADCDPDKWDEFIDNYRGDASKVPIISVADLNLAMNKHGFALFMSPFCNFILNGADFVSSDSGPQADLLRNLTFVADSCMAATNRAAGAINLSRSADQPLASPYDRNDTLSANDVPLTALVSGEHNNFTRNLERRDSPFFQAVEFVQLYDYLDKDSIPSSLALPTVERTPMATAMGVSGNFAVLVDKSNYVKDVPDASGVVNERYNVTTYTLKLAGNMRVDAGAVYPFKYDRGGNENYNMEAVATIAFVPQCAPESDGLLRCTNAKAPAYVTCANGWSDINTGWVAKSADGGGKISVLTAKSQPSSITFNADPKTEEEAKAQDVHLSFASFGSGAVFASELPAGNCYNADICTFRKCTRETKQMVNGVATWVQDAAFVDNTPLDDRIGWLPMTKDLGGVVAAADIGNAPYMLSMQVWVRIFNSNGTVDLMPASWQDDKSACDLLQNANGSSKGAMLRFRDATAANTSVEFDQATGDLRCTGTGPFSPYPVGYLADDPRFNFAPEDLRIIGNAEDGELGELWLKDQRSAGGDRDGDIFMFVSDSGYLQSAYELAYLVKVSDGNSNPFGILESSSYNGKARTNFGDCPANAAMWRTYSQYDNGHSSGRIEELDIISGSKGFRINPYTQSKEIMLSALANTPLNWWAAGTNFVNDTRLRDLHSSWDNAMKYTFSQWSGAKVNVRHDDIEKVADAIMSKFRSSSDTGSWRSKFDDLGWDDDTGVAGVDIAGVTLHSVDRKFLHGYWKECFDNRQQLFLIFLRAEPMMMGGGGMKQTPPQLGARAVALVWRDPAATNASSGESGYGPPPHRTRVLFYRQFD